MPLSPGGLPVFDTDLYIMSIKRRFGGYRNPSHVKIVIYFDC